MKYVFNDNIPTTLIQLRDDGEVNFFIRLNCTDGKLLVPLCITTEKKNDNHEYESIINIDFNQGFQTRPGVLTRGGERVKGSEVQPGRTGVQPEG